MPQQDGTGRGLPRGENCGGVRRDFRRVRGGDGEGHVVGGRHVGRDEERRNPIVRGGWRDVDEKGGQPKPLFAADGDRADRECASEVGADTLCPEGDGCGARVHVEDSDGLGDVFFGVEEDQLLDGRDVCVRRSKVHRHVVRVQLIDVHLERAGRKPLDVDGGDWRDEPRVRNHRDPRDRHDQPKVDSLAVPSARGRAGRGAASGHQRPPLAHGRAEHHLSGAHDPRVIRSDVLGDRETFPREELEEGFHRGGARGCDRFNPDLRAKGRDRVVRVIHVEIRERVWLLVRREVQVIVPHSVADGGPSEDVALPPLHVDRQRRDLEPREVERQVHVEFRVVVLRVGPGGDDREARDARRVVLHLEESDRVPSREDNARMRHARQRVARRAGKRHRDRECG
mmetsp:Transcript_29604/g.68960  ORF Transcript_29604/g.68960 Transcript_29604/m.68960 type:complete len:398 (-) Transcript_29604:115-1308(-)